MREILVRRNVEVLAQFAWSETLLGFDFDGTLAPIVDDPGAAAMPETTRALLGRLARAYPCAVISGRSLGDLRGRLRGLPSIQLVGNHGLEPSRSADAFARKVARWVPELERRLAPFPGVTVEDKTFSVAVHYRRSRGKGRARSEILACAAELGPLRVIGGKQVVNLLPEGAPHKGIALRAARERARCDTAVYVGDDETDEDVFALGEPGRLLGIRVGASRSSGAGYFLRRRRDVDRLLARLLALRPAGWSGARRPA
jgi:trehalose 6-phosphate phosphatase